MKDPAAALALIDEACARYRIAGVLGLFSGGHDSLTAVHVASKHPKFTAAVHINTGIGVAETREFVRSTCKSFGWPLREYSAIDCGQDYREIVKKYGFPGPPQHKAMYIRLKERPLRAAIREVKLGRNRLEKTLLISGARSQESERRMGHVEPIYKEPGEGRVWVSVIHDWSKHECNEYLAANNVPRNPVVDLIHKSGECLCGAYAKPGELKELACWFPKTADEIKALEKEVAAAGHPCGWEDKRTSKRKVNKNMPMCHGCEKAPAPLGNLLGGR